MTEDESVSEYNERVLEIVNDLLLLGEKIPKSKIVRKVLRSLSRKFDMKVTDIEESQDITMLKLDELFGSLLTFEMAMSNRETNQDESIALLTKQFSKMARKFKSLNTAGKTEKTGRHDGENFTRKVNDFSYRRNSDHGKKKEDVGRSFRCRECEEFVHYQAECPTYLRRQKKKYCATLSDEDSYDDEDDHDMNDFTAYITKINLEVDSECSDIDEDEELTLEELKMLRKEDSEARVIQKERIQDLMDENERLMRVILSLNLDSILNSKQNGSSNNGLRFDTSTRGVKIMPEGQKIIRIRSDHGKEFDNEDLNNFCQTEGIHHEFADPITPQQNGVVEWKNKTLQEMAQVMIHAKNLPLNFWGEAVNTTCHIHNRVTTRSGDLQPDSAKTNSNITDEVINNETVLVPSAHVKKNHPSSSIIGNLSAGITTRSKEKDEYWINVMQEELLQFKHNNVWTLVPKPDGANIIGTKWIFKNKTDESGSVVRNKACLVAQGYAQVEGVDFDETFAPVARLEAIRLLLRISCFRKFKLFQMDVKSAFLNGYLNEEVYVAQPKGFIDSEFPQYVYKINKALYGLKQAPRAWYERLIIYLDERGYSKGETDKTLFINRTSTDLIVAQIYVDDIIFGGFPKTLVNNFINIIKSEFEISLVGKLSYFLGLQIKQRSKGMFISQEKYAKNLVKKFGLDQSQYKRTLAATHVKITKDTVGTAIDHKLYRSMIGSLLYLTASRPDIAYAVGICARYQSDPRTSHLNAVKRIIKYVHGTTDFGILYSYDTSSELVGYCDAD
ncbi:gag-pol polyprotein [Cucumis melo var. makuwa]|uniref:Gag-pol polyprotein n=1 Tax=Cucumis melo var. makuwa TaxID=1194695 RepID=A0A5D3BIP9_CUCMM|nr:gag-pol polyprotein [Cucumis melo var. makuwa]